MNSFRAPQRPLTAPAAIPTAAPEIAPAATPQALRGEIIQGGIPAMCERIRANPSLKPVEQVGEQVKAIFKVFEETVGQISEKVGEISKQIEAELQRLADCLGLERTALNPYIPPQKDTPPEENTSEGPVEDKAKIQPAEEKDIVGFLGKRHWLEYAKKACKQFKVPLHILLAVIRCESRFRPDNPTYIDPETGKPKSSARGLGQFLSSDWYGEGISETEWKAGKRSPGSRGFVNAPRDENPWGEQANRENPEHAMWATARHIRNKIRDANSLVGQKGFPEHFRLDLNSSNPEMVKWIYMAYMSGGYGYCLLRRYIEDPSTKNWDRLADFQKEEAFTKDGRVLRRSYIDRAKNASERGMRIAQSYFTQIQSAPELARIHIG